MDFNFSTEQEMIRNMIREFTENEVAPYDGDMDKSGEFPWEIIKKMADNGIVWLFRFPKSLVDAGADAFCEAITLEELARGGSGSVSITLDAHMLCAHPIRQFGTEEQKKKNICLI